MKEDDVLTKRKKLIIFSVIVVSIILYLAGVFSGLYANNLIKKETSQDINQFKSETEKNIQNIKSTTTKDLVFLKNYINTLDDNLKNTQLELLFLDTLNQKEKCGFYSLTMNQLLNEMKVFWEILPNRVEEYEKNNPLTPEYIALKKQYTDLSLKTWILSKDYSTNCDNNFIHGIYFYSKDCKNCIKQGMELDKLQKNFNEKIIILTIDLKSNNTIIKFLKEQYNLTSTPAMIINNHVFKDKTYSEKEILETIKNEKK